MRPVAEHTAPWRAENDAALSEEIDIETLDDDPVRPGLTLPLPHPDGTPAAAAATETGPERSGEEGRPHAREDDSLSGVPVRTDTAAPVAAAPYDGRLRIKLPMPIHVPHDRLDVNEGEGEKGAGAVADDMDDAHQPMVGVATVRASPSPPSTPPSLLPSSLAPASSVRPLRLKLLLAAPGPQATALPLSELTAPAAVAVEDTDTSALHPPVPAAPALIDVGGSEISGGGGMSAALDAHVPHQQSYTETHITPPPQPSPGVVDLPSGQVELPVLRALLKPAAVRLKGVQLAKGRAGRAPARGPHSAPAAAAPSVRQLGRPPPYPVPTSLLKASAAVAPKSHVDSAAPAGAGPAPASVPRADDASALGSDALHPPPLEQTKENGVTVPMSMHAYQSADAVDHGKPPFPRVSMGLDWRCVEQLIRGACVGRGGGWQAFCGLPYSSAPSCFMGTLHRFRGRNRHAPTAATLNGTRIAWRCGP
jgi:hypothetical protein